MEQPKICIINEDVKQLEASHANCNYCLLSILILI